jgi:hypothetical protein
VHPDDDRNRLKAFEILANLVHSEEWRTKLSNEGYLKRVFDEFSQKGDRYTLDKLSWMTTLICFYPDMIDEIIRSNLLSFIIKMTGT